MNIKDNAYKHSLFENAEAYYNEAVDLYHAGRREDAEYYETCFRDIFAKIRALGWDKEYMGIS